MSESVLVAFHMTSERFLETVEVIKSNALSCRQAEKKYSCPQSCIYDNVHGIPKSWKKRKISCVAAMFFVGLECTPIAIETFLDSHQGLFVSFV